MKYNVSHIVDNGLCTSCGLCAASCSRKCITFEYGQERNVPIVDSVKCNYCGLCYEVCPGKGIALNHIGHEMYGHEIGVKYNLCTGYYLHTYVGHSTNHEIRLHAATGGMVSQFLIWLLRKGEIDGAVVVRYKEGQPFEPEPFIATTEAEVWDSRSSKYVVLSMDKVAQQIACDGFKRLVVVGLPCQIQGWRQLAKKNKRVRDSIKGYFAIYCSVNKTKRSLEYYPLRYKVNKGSVGRFTFRDDGCMGYMKFEAPNGKVLKKVSYLSFWFGTHSFFANTRCSLCIDQLGELADISFGDIHIKPYSNDTIGTNSVITRSGVWNELLLKCKEEGCITLDEIPVEILNQSQIYTKTFKKGAGVKTNMILRNLFRRENPNYDYVYNGKVSIKNILSEVSKAIMRTIGRHKKLWWIIMLLDRNKD